MRFLRSVTGRLMTALTAPVVRMGEPITVSITYDVLVADVERLGMHFGGDNFYDSSALGSASPRTPGPSSTAGPS